MLSPSARKRRAALRWRPCRTLEDRKSTNYIRSDDAVATTAPTPPQTLEQLKRLQAGCVSRHLSLHGRVVGKLLGRRIAFITTLQSYFFMDVLAHLVRAHPAAGAKKLRSFS